MSTFHPTIEIKVSQVPQDIQDIKRNYEASAHETASKASSLAKKTIRDLKRRSSSKEKKTPEPTDERGRSIRRLKPVNALLKDDSSYYYTHSVNLRVPNNIFELGKNSKTFSRGGYFIKISDKKSNSETGEGVALSTNISNHSTTTSSSSSSNSAVDPKDKEKKTFVRDSNFSKLTVPIINLSLID